MSLTQRIWLVTLLLLVLACGSSLVISYMALRHHAEQTLGLKNADSAQALALSIAQMDNDPALLQRLLSAQFDSGHYRHISLTGQDGDFSFVRDRDVAVVDVPAWFVALTRLAVPPAMATIEDGGQQFATLKVASRYQYAYQTLWHSARNLFISFIAIFLLSLLLIGWLVRSIRRPLASVVTQARQLSDRRFSVVPESRIRELRQVTAAMNQLSYAMHEMLAQESHKLERLRTRLRVDEVTGLNSRQYLLDQLDGLLHRNDQLAHGMLAMIRVPGLAQLNTDMGYKATNGLLLAVGKQLTTIEQAYPRAHAGRLNGSEFALIVAGDQQSDRLAPMLSQALTRLPGQTAAIPALPIALICYGPGDDEASLFTALDAALAIAESRADGRAEIATGTTRSLFASREATHAALAYALHTGALRLRQHAVISPDNALLHEECPSQLYFAGEWRAASLFIPWITRFAMTVAFDLQLIDTALYASRHQMIPIAINLTPQSLTQPGFIDALTSRLAAHPASEQLLLEWPAAGALANREAFEAVVTGVTSLGYTVGLKHLGRELARVDELHNLGLSRVKLDSALIRGIHQQLEQQAYISGLCTLLHSLGVTVIAEGVQSQQEAATLEQLGIDGLTGPHVVYPCAVPRA